MAQKGLNTLDCFFHVHVQLHLAPFRASITLSTWQHRDSTRKICSHANDVVVKSRKLQGECQHPGSASFENRWVVEREEDWKSAVQIRPQQARFEVGPCHDSRLFGFE